VSWSPRYGVVRDADDACRDGLFERKDRLSDVMFDRKQCKLVLRFHATICVSHDISLVLTRCTSTSPRCPGCMHRDLVGAPVQFQRGARNASSPKRLITRTVRLPTLFIEDKTRACMQQVPGYLEHRTANKYGQFPTTYAPQTTQP
jgi:hypothetical protein